MKRRILICGAAGRDFHNFNVLYRDNSDYEVAAFTAAQIPDIEGRTYPSELAGQNYPSGIPIYSESELSDLIQKLSIDEVVFSYSDVTNQHVMNISAIANAAGASFSIPSPAKTMIKSVKTVISVCAVRTGCGKSQTSRRVSHILKSLGKTVAVIRHPMPYGDLMSQKIQRFASKEDLKKQNCTIEEMEEYEPHIERGQVVFAGVDYEAILREAEKEADIILWDGGNNDTPFYKPDLEIVVTDPHRAGDELLYYPGLTNFLRADVLIINKMDSAKKKDIKTLENNIKKYNPGAIVIKADSRLEVDNPELIKGKKSPCYRRRTNPYSWRNEIRGRSCGCSKVRSQRTCGSETLDCWHDNRYFQEISRDRNSPSGHGIWQETGGRS